MAVAEEGHDTGVFNPYDQMDRDDINYVHTANYDAVRTLVEKLPPGWKRRDPKEVGPGQPPYAHDSGATSWRNPNFRQVMDVVDARNEALGAADGGGGGGRAAHGKRVKKLRLMLQAGAPLGAVEQRAKLEGIDMALVLSPSDEKKEDDKVGAGREGDDQEGVPIPETLVKKYKRMVKAGVPLDRVHQLAGVEAGASPEQVDSVLKGGGRDGSAEEKDERPCKNPRMAKFVRMQKAGIPLVAIQNAARLQGHDMKELEEALVGKGREKDARAEGKKDAAAKKQKLGDDAKRSEPNVFNPFEEMDTDNINYYHSVNYAEAQELMEKLPPGWKRRDPKEVEPGQPPYVHEPSGETSWKHPNFQKVMDVADEVAARGRLGANFANSKEVKKLRAMIRAGLPMGAVEQRARLEGVDMALVLSEEKKEEDGVAPGKNDGDEAGDPSLPWGECALIEPSAGGPHFTVQEGNVCFPSSRGGVKAHPLTDLVRKMAQTVQKTSHFGVGASRGEMVVDGPTLFHVLGALRGVQFARDEYNSTVGAGMRKELVNAKRHGFAEMASSIGMTLPDGASQVDIEGLDELIRHVQTANIDQLERGRSLMKDGYYNFDSIHTLYAPGSFVVAKHAGGGGVDCVCQVVWHRYVSCNDLIFIEAPIEALFAHPLSAFLFP